MVDRREKLGTIPQENKSKLGRMWDRWSDRLGISSVQGDPASEPLTQAPDNVLSMPPRTPEEQKSALKEWVPPETQVTPRTPEEQQVIGADLNVVNNLLQGWQDKEREIKEDKEREEQKRKLDEASERLGIHRSSEEIDREKKEKEKERERERLYGSGANWP